MQATHAQIIAELVSRATGRVARVLTSYLLAPDLTGDDHVLVIDGDSILSATDRKYGGVLIDLTVLVPIDEAAVELFAAKVAAQASAEERFDDIMSGILDQAPDPWRLAWRETRPAYRLVRPASNVLCAAASARFGFAL